MKHAGRLLTDVICLLISYYSAGLNLYLLPSVVPAVAFAAFLCINSQERKMLLPAAVCGLLSPYPLLRFPVGYAVLVLPQLRLKNRRHRWMIVIEGCVFLAAVHVVKPEDIFVMATVGVGTMVSLIRILPWACIVLLAAEMYFLNKASGMEERLYQVEKIDAAAARQMEQIAGRDKAILKISHHIRKHLGEMSEQNEVLYNAL